jgi:flagellar biosynthetic protein FliR
MTVLNSLPTADLESFLLCFFRITTLIMVAPIFGNARVPVVIKTAMSLGICLVVFPGITHLESPVTELGQFLSLAVREVFAGALIGMAAHVLFAGVQMGGTLIGIQMGFAIVRVMDPLAQEQRSVIAELYLFFAVLVFLILDGHHLLIKALVLSFKIIQLGTFAFVLSSLQGFIRLVGAIFMIGLEVAAPVMAVLFLTDAAMGLVARTVPQMNVFIIGFPVKIATGLFFLSMTMPLVFHALNVLFSRLDADLLSLLYGM